MKPSRITILLTIAIALTSPPLLRAAAPSAAPAANSTAAPAEQNDAYTAVADAYMQGKWNDLDALLKDSASLAKLNKDQSADINYIRQALLECRPAWWASAKSGKATILAITVSLWKKTFPVHYSASSTPHLDISTNEFGNEYDLQFSTAKLEATDPAGDLGNTNAGDAQKVSLWQSLAVITVRIESDPLMKSRPATDLIANITRYGHFREAVTSGYYGSPGARRRTMIQCLEALSPDKNDKEEALGWRAVGSALLAELIAHHDRYPSIAWPADPLPSTGAQANEAATAKLVGDQLGDIKFTVNEDKALRNFFKDLADANPDVKTAMTTGIVKLPDSQTYALDPKKDPELAGKRFAFLAVQSKFFGTIPAPHAPEAAPATAAPAIAQSSRATLPEGAPAAQSSAQARPPSPLFEELTALYMKGDWDTLETKLKSTSSLAALPKSEQDDIAYIKTAIAEGHPDWWKKIKSGASQTYRATLWNKTYQFNFKVGSTLAFEPTSPNATLSWPNNKMESQTPADGEDKGFMEGDQSSEAVWHWLELARMSSDMRDLIIDSRQKSLYDTISYFRFTLTAAYYGTPHARALSFVEALRGQDPKNQSIVHYISRGPLAWSLFVDMSQHPERYPSFHFVAPDQLPAGGNAESRVREYFKLLPDDFRSFHYTFAEDKVLRNLAKSLGENPRTIQAVAQSPEIKIPGGQTVVLQPQSDAGPKTKRIEFVNGLIGKTKPMDTARAGASATPATAPAPASNVNGFYSDAINAYMTADWDTLQNITLKNSAAIAKLSKDQQADIAYIKSALAECHPSWWNATKTGNSASLNVSLPLWKINFPAHYTNGIRPDVKLQAAQGRIDVNVAWPGSTLDSKNLIDAPRDKFTEADQLDFEIWRLLAAAGSELEFRPLTQAQPPKAQQDNLQHYRLTREMMASIYFGTPTSRRLSIMRCLMTFTPAMNQGQEEIADWRPAGLAIMGEMIVHHERYPSVHWSKSRFPEYNGHGADESVYTAFYPQFQVIPFTFAEDKGFRAAIEALADANPNPREVMTTGLLKLPNGQTFAYDSAKDAELSRKRYQWAVDHTGFSEAATKPH